MRVTYDPMNLQGVIDYLVREGVDTHGDTVRWIEQRTVQLSDRAPVDQSFVVIERGVGFFRDYPTLENAPAFQTETARAGPAGADRVHVAYWIFAQPLKD